MTASNVIRGRHEKMSEQTRARVLEAMRELDYRPVAAMSPQNRRVETHVISLVFDCVDMDDAWGRPTFRGMREAAHELDYDLLTHTRPRTNWSLDQEELRFLDRRSDGLIFVVPINRRAVLSTLARHKVPVVTCFTTEDVPGIASVTLDLTGAIRHATRYVFDKGHRRIGYLGGLKNRSDCRDERAAYRATMKSVGLKDEIFCIEALGTGYDMTPIEKMVDAILEKPLSAIVCGSDTHALLLWEAATRRGLKVPRDVSIISVGDLPQAEKLGLTSARYSSEDMGRCALHAVAKIIGGEPASACNRVLPLDFIERTSVRALKNC